MYIKFKIWFKYSILDNYKYIKPKPGSAGVDDNEINCGDKRTRYPGSGSRQLI